MAATAHDDTTPRAETIRGITQEQQDAIEAWSHRNMPFLVGAAVLPLFDLGGERIGWLPDAILIVSWLIFLVDLIVRVRIAPRYLRTWWGLFDLAIVIVTFPWTLVLPGPKLAEALLAARLARVARIIVIAVRGAPAVGRLVNRLGRAFAYVTVIVLFSAYVVNRVEPPSSGIDSYGDGVWWAIVTLTTVGYGDMVPVTTTGRVVGVFVMIVGLAFLGAIAGTLASFFGIAPKDDATPQQDETEDLG